MSSSRLKGNFNLDSTTNILDVQYVLNWIAGGGNSQNQTVAFKGNSYTINDQKILLDTSAGGVINILDAQYILNWIAGGGNMSNKTVTFKGNEYTIDYVGDDLTWNQMTKELANSKYRYFFEMYNIPIGTESIIANIKPNDGIIINNTDTSSGNISSKSNVNSGYVTNFDGTNNTNLNQDVGSPINAIELKTNNFYHKSLCVPMIGPTTTLKEIIIFVFRENNGYSGGNNAGILAKLDLSDVPQNPVHRNDTVILDHYSRMLYHHHNSVVTTIDLSSKLQNDVLFL